MRATVRDCADAARIAALHKRCFSEPWDEASVAGLLGQPGLFALAVVGSNENELQGFGLFRVAADESEILSLATAPEYRRRGVARALVREGGAKAHGLNARAMFLEVAERNDAAVALYQSLGFCAVGRRKAYYRHVNRAEDALTLRAELPFVRPPSDT